MQKVFWIPLIVTLLRAEHWNILTAFRALN